MAILVFSGGARLQVDASVERVVQAFRDGLSRDDAEWVAFERDGFETWIYTPEIAAVPQDDDPRAAARM